MTRTTTKVLIVETRTDSDKIPPASTRTATASGGGERPGVDQVLAVIAHFDADPSLANAPSQYRPIVNMLVRGGFASVTVGEANPRLELDVESLETMGWL